MGLPKNWRNISNFYLLTNQELLTHGWYPYTFVAATPTSNQTYNGTSLSIGQTSVTETQLVRSKTQQEIDAEIAQQWQTIRSQRDSLLDDTDWTQLPDSPLTEQKKSEFATYRQSLRDITTTYATPSLVVWPTIPSYPAT